MNAADTKQRVKTPATPDIDRLPRSTVLRTAQVQVITGFGAGTLKMWRRKGKGPQVTLIEGNARYLAGDVRDWIKNAAKMEVS